MAAIVSVCSQDDTLWAQVYWSATNAGYIISFTLAALTWVPDRRSKRCKSQWITTVFTFYLVLCWAALWIIQTRLNDPRPDPFCPARTFYGFPSMNTFYTSAFFGFVVSLTYLSNRAMSWFWWLKLIVLTIAVPVTLAFYGPSTWKEIVISLGLGLSSAIMFVIFVFYAVRPLLPWVLNTWPFDWLECVDTYILNEEEQRETQRIREWKKKSLSSGP